MPKKYFLVTKCVGYITKPDKTNAPYRSLVNPSQNVLVNDQEKVQIRNGYSLYGASSATRNAVESAFDWENSSGDELHLRCLNDEVQFYDTNQSAWTTLKDGFSAVDFSFTTWWDTSEGIDLLLFVNGDDNIYDWSGAIATLASATANTITKNGSTTWAQERFLTAGTRKVMINDTEYTYTGGETSTTLTGVTPDPSGEAADSTVFQSVRTNATEPASGTVNDVIATHKNQVWVGSNESREVYVSKDTDFKDYAYSSPRLPGEGALLTLDNICRGFKVLQNVMMISAGQDDWYVAKFHELEISTTLSETLYVTKLKTSPRQAAQSQDFICGDYFLSFEPVLREIIGIDANDNLITKDLSDPIKTDFDAETFTNGHLKVHRNRIYVSAPTNDKVYINEWRMIIDAEGNQKKMTFWQPPQILPVRKFAIVSGDLYGHSNRVQESYKLFDGTDDNDKSFKATAAFAYRNFGNRANLKILDELLTEGYIAANTKVTVYIRYDYEGSTQLVEKEIDGGDDDILFESIAGGALGDQPLGDAPLGDEPETSTGNPKFRIIHNMEPKDFHELQVEFETDTQDAQWEILAHGGNTRLSPNQPINLKK